jgi:hypothetical protein
MLIKFNSLLTYRKLKLICKINGIKYVSNCNKSQIIHKINSHKTAAYIQRRFRKGLMKNESCPISHEKITYPFISIKLGTFFFYYDFASFIKYLNKCKDFRDPCTRAQITDTKLNEINKLILYYYGQNTTKIIISPTMLTDIEFNIITFCMYDIITELNNISDLSIDELYSNILPRIIYYSRFLLKNHNKENCRIIISACSKSINTINTNTSIVTDYLESLLNI